MRKLSLTDDGQMLLGLARPVLDGVDGMEAALVRLILDGTVRLAGR
jgi:DNA-binding transcriptional LysR family regulator